MPNQTQQRLRMLPKIDSILAQPAWRALIEQWGQPPIVQACRAALDSAREILLEAPQSSTPAEFQKLIQRELDRSRQRLCLRPLQPVVNATGVILHTNLGRAKLDPDLLAEVLPLLSNSTNLELDLLSGRRGKRGDWVRASVARLCGAEDALVVNNNAAAVLLALSALADGREVLVSRGELVQIGGGFRIPEVIVQGGAILREVGTTNITTLNDYQRALSDRTGAVLKVHLSNFKLQGFTSRPKTSQLANLLSSYQQMTPAAAKILDQPPESEPASATLSLIPLIEDLGSGNLITEYGHRILPDPTPARVLAEGADLVCFSGDKLLGGPQAGLIAGRRELVTRLARHPLMRAIRPDKLVYGLLQVVLAAYERGCPERLSPWRELQRDKSAIEAQIDAFREKFGLSRTLFPTVDSEGAFGSGSMAEVPIPSAALRVSTGTAEALSETFRRGQPPILGIIRADSFLLDFLTIDQQDEPALAKALKSSSEGGDANG